MELALSTGTKQAQGRRSAFEMIMDVLAATREGPVKPTHVMYRSNTSWPSMQKNLAYLTKSGFVSVTGEHSRAEYSITEKGVSILEDYKSLVGRATTRPREAEH